MGPPAAIDTWLVRRLFSGRFVFASVNGAAFHFGLRWYHSAVPDRRFVPDFVVALMTPPPVCPNCAEYADVCVVNSWTVSSVTLTVAVDAVSTFTRSTTAVLNPRASTTIR